MATLTLKPFPRPVGGAPFAFALAALALTALAQAPRPDLAPGGVPAGDPTSPSCVGCHTGGTSAWPEPDPNPGPALLSAHERAAIARTLP